MLEDGRGSRGTRGKSRILWHFGRLGVLPGVRPPAGSQVQSEGKCILTENNVLKVHRYHRCSRRPSGFRLEADSMHRSLEASLRCGEAWDKLKWMKKTHSA